MLARDASAGPSPAWSLLATGLLGRPLQIQAQAQTPDNAPPARPILTATHLLLPVDMAASKEQGPGWHRAAIAHAVAHLRFSPAALPSRGLKAMSVALISAVEDARVEQLLMREHPGVRHWFVTALAGTVREEALDAAALISRMDLALADPQYRDGHHWVDKARTLFKAQADKDLTDYVAFRSMASVLANDLGQMRVPFRAQLYAVPSSYRDDNSYLWSHEPSNTPPPPELELKVNKSSSRLSVPSHPVPEDAQPVGAPELELGRSWHPEWDHRLALARQDWCTVIDKLPAWQDAGNEHGRPGPAGVTGVGRFRKPRELDRACRLRRQRDGPELDLDAVIDLMAGWPSHRSVEPRLFVRTPQATRQASILVLLDLSESTNDRAHEGGPSLLDLEKQAALVLADAVLSQGDRVAIHGFSSNTRAEVSYYHLLGFGEPLNIPARRLIAAAPARHSTRMGAALRRAVACLSREPGDVRAILVVTDGAPSDVDVHVPRYLVEDARAAVLEARAGGVQIHGLAVDRQADDYARRIFGWRGYHLIDNPASLAARLQGVYGRLTAA